MHTEQLCIDSRFPQQAPSPTFDARTYRLSERDASLAELVELGAPLGTALDGAVGDDGGGGNGERAKAGDNVLVGNGSHCGVRFPGLFCKSGRGSGEEELLLGGSPAVVVVEKGGGRGRAKCWGTRRSSCSEECREWA